MGWHAFINFRKSMDLKDKLKLFQRLRNDKHAENDLQLLKAKSPSYPYIPRFDRDPKRYAYDIQYALLDVASEEEIVKNRTPAETSGKTSTKKTSSKTSTKKTSSKTSTKKQNKNKTKSATSEKEKNTDDGSSKTLTDGEASSDSSPEASSDTLPEDLAETSSEASSEISTEEESSKKK